MKLTKDERSVLLHILEQWDPPKKQVVTPYGDKLIASIHRKAKKG